MSFRSKISFADRWFLYFLLSNFSLRSTTRAYPTEHLSYCFLKPTIIGLHKKLYGFRSENRPFITQKWPSYDAKTYH